ncbi:ShlB/FhaC/HecB family hemolysin secretion/activation protein [Ramlibacter sp.]|uniref:ShlB/FhaC/HecB family hemolysin secretion/activation protein n=1 Tax=Ramlibacter aquaticus TaxID=2780094 RepID=A0ABR9SL29_9BURK|nr:ShlB/FhaC/HecB family hemolysin secretion/activation protein [Ramlibacter sp.]MBE7942742.1 ShlB/FhaC/HecB family hemolysin secretion/activation protein [Ramlibacter aquaticus]
MSRTLQETAPTPGSLPRVVSGRRGAEGAVLSVHVDDFLVEGAASVDPAAVREALAPFRGRTLNAAQLLQACDAIAALYRREGKLARVLIPAQASAQAVLRIEVVEAQLAAVRVEGQPARVDAGFVERVVRQALGDSRPLDLAALERGILLANDLPGVSADGVLKAGDAPGDTVLALRIADGADWQAGASVNSWGSRFTGEEQVLLNAARNLARGEQISAGVVASTGLQALRLGAEAPLGVAGLKLQASASGLQYRLGREYKPLDARGDAATTSLGLSYPLVRTQSLNLRLAATADHARYRDDSLGERVRERSVDGLTLALSGDWSDPLPGSSLTPWGVQARAGRVRLGVADDRAADAAGPGTEGGFSLLGAQIARHLAWAGGWSGSVGLRAQWALANLDSAEKFALGGPTALRAYPVNEASGDSGWILSGALRRSFDGGFTLGLFSDIGHVRVHTRPWARDANQISLQDLGATLEWRSGRVGSELSLALPLARNPAAAHGRNQDGSDHGPRLWWRLQYAL